MKDNKYLVKLIEISQPRVLCGHKIRKMVHL